MVRPKKYLGQHFLKDKKIAYNIVNALEGNDVADVLEIGAGTGVLTEILLKRDFRLYTIEVDKESVIFLQNNFIDLQDKIIEGDFLKFDLKSYFDSQIAVIGNFPYNISSQILFRVLEFKEMITEVVGMFQKEVAERIASKPGNKVYGILSVLMQAYYDIEYLFTVDESVFYPPPKVKSGVIRLKRKENYVIDCNDKLFKQIIKMGFNQRRKTLRNSLKQITGNIDTSDLIFNKRPEQLSVNEFVFLTNLIEEKIRTS
ncbi:MAG: 16S rRNA (adenine(1518)-N(6)/adenine(1519)-N(6))-dimethyltransferase RsmA [Bacteroidales bacterium]|nr:16S rRNA (adenine(1518)-N(6)/adenine(1519)-N(6))-dimethyltransferase RsmA [Bacteroidales bacterium]